MANLLNRFFDQVIGSSEKIRDYIALISSRGDFQRIEDLNVILTSWNNILLTPRRTYILDPEFGSDLYKYVFEPADSVTMESIRYEVKTSIMNYDDRAKIMNISIIFLNNKKGYIVDCEVLYEGNRGSFNTTIDEATITAM